MAETSTRHNAKSIRFEAKLITIGYWVVVRLPKDASAQLPSRGQTMVEGTFNGIYFKTPLEPDGDWSHWFKPDKKVLDTAKVRVRDTVTLEIRPIKDWVEPVVPEDLQKALANNPHARELWQQITPMARWEWVRWSRSTNNPETRKRRIEVACSKLNAGKRRPCCWNRNLCTEPAISKNGVLITV